MENILDLDGQINAFLINAQSQAHVDQLFKPRVSFTVKGSIIYIIYLLDQIRGWSL